MHTLFATGGDPSIFLIYGALADQNRSDTLALKLVLGMRFITITSLHKQTSYKQIIHHPYGVLVFKTFEYLSTRGTTCMYSVQCRE